MNRQLSLNRWSPMFDDFRKEMNRLMEGFLHDESPSQSSFFTPHADFSETDKAYEVSFDLPGMKPEDVTIEFKDGHLWVSGERKHEHEEKGKSFHRVERSYGQFRRVISLGNDVDGDNIEASYRDGVLAVTLPKVEAVRPKRIEVKA